MSALDPISMIRPRRNITGMSAVLLPFTSTGEPEWPSFAGLVDRTLASGLVPAVNMDTGYANLIDEATRTAVLDVAEKQAGGGRFVAGAYVGDEPGASFAPDRYRAAIAPIVERGGTPVIFQSHGLTGLAADAIVAAYDELARDCDEFIAFELGTMFATSGRIYDLEVYEGLLSIDKCSGAKHSSLDRGEEWKRIQLRDRVRPDFSVFTGNDLAIDMVMYGSDYLLGLSAFAPDVFARRDACWAGGDPAFYELNDKLQYLGAFAFRDPVPAYKHSAAQFLHLRGWISEPAAHPRSPMRPDLDVEVLRGIAASLGLLGA